METLTDQMFLFVIARKSVSLHCFPLGELYILAKVFSRCLELKSGKFREGRRKRHYARLCKCSGPYCTLSWTVDLAPYSRVWSIGRVHLSGSFRNLSSVDAKRLHTFVLILLNVVGARHTVIPMKSDSIQSKTIEWLRFFCIGAVVLLHAVGSPLEGKDIISYQYGAYDTIRILFSEGLCSVAVPIFFLISGYLFFVKLEEWRTEVWVEKLKRRGRTLLIPYLLWNLIAIVFSLAMLYPKHVLKGGDVPDLADWYYSIGGLRAFWDSGTGGLPINYPLWYIRDLIVFVILSPVLFYYVKKTGLVGLVLLFVAYVFNLFGSVPGLSKEGLLFFSLGAFLSIRRIDFTAICKKYLNIATCVGVPLVLAMVYTYGNNDEAWGYAHRLFTLFGSATTIGIAAMLLQKGRIQYHQLLSKSSFLVFAAHGTIVLPFFQFVLSKVLPNNQIGLIIKYFSAPLFTVAVLVLCYFFLSKWMPNTLSILTGGRER